MTLDALVIWNDDREHLNIRNDLDEMMSDVHIEGNLHLDTFIRDLSSSVTIDALVIWADDRDDLKTRNDLGKMMMIDYLVIWTDDMEDLKKKE